MNREIKKVRGLSLKGEWIFGTPHSYGDGIFICQTELMNNDGKDYRIPAIEIQPETLGYPTSLKDKHGKEIYEGDILSSIYGDGKPYPIAFGEFRDYITADVECNDTIIGFYWDESSDRKSAFGKSVDGNMDHCEIIGNIHSNPELLK